VGREKNCFESWNIRSTSSSLKMANETINSICLFSLSIWFSLLLIWKRWDHIRNSNVLCKKETDWSTSIINFVRHFHTCWFHIVIFFCLCCVMLGHVKKVAQSILMNFKQSMIE
jgi:hypothetical protein